MHNSLLRPSPHRRIPSLESNLTNIKKIIEGKERILSRMEF